MSMPFKFAFVCYFDNKPVMAATATAAMSYNTQKAFIEDMGHANAVEGEFVTLDALLDMPIDTFKRWKAKDATERFYMFEIKRCN